MTACNKPDADMGGKVRIAAMNGPTMMGFGEMYADMKEAGDESAYTIDKLTSPDEVAAGLAKKKYDAACIPCNTAAALANDGMDIQVVAINTLNVLYLVQRVGTPEINSLADLAGKTVYMPGKTMTPEYSFKYLLKKNNVQNVNVEFETDGSAISAGLKDTSNTKYNYAVLPQPAATGATSGAGAARVALNLTDEWKKISGNADTDIVTGVLVVRKAFLKNNQQAFDKFIEDYEASVEFMTNAANLDTAAQYIADMGITAPKAAIPKCGISFIDGAQMKSMVQTFLTRLNEYDKESTGGKIPTDKFYYGA